MRIDALREACRSQVAGTVVVGGRSCHIPLSTPVPHPHLVRSGGLATERKFGTHNLHSVLVSHGGLRCEINELSQHAIVAADTP
jgi:hypothetical protein